MKLASFLLQSRGPVNLAKRLPTIVKRFGITDSKIDRCLNSFVDTAVEYGTRPTLAITANLLDRYPSLVQRLRDRGVEFAIHGLVHTDYSQLSFKEHLEHIAKAMEIFDRYDIEYGGFRCPYLRSSQYTLDAVKELGFSWESSDVIAWDIIDPKAITSSASLAYDKLLSLYSAKSSATNFSVPKLVDGVVEIPVSIPDDEAILDRLGLRGAPEITRLWRAILNASYQRGDIFTVQLHHERVPFLAPALESVLSKASSLSPKVWLASLGEVASWYKRRESFKFELAKIDKGLYQVDVRADDDATVLVKNVSVDGLAHDWHGAYQLVKDRNFKIAAPKRPVIGVENKFDETFAELLKSEGFVVERTENPASCALYLASSDLKDIRDEVSLISSIEGSGAPLLRFWRWPNAARSAISVTGDIDSITLIDFARRVFEV